MNIKNQQGSIWIVIIILTMLLALVAIILSPVAEDTQNLATKFGWKSKTQLKKDLNESKFAVNAAVKVNEDLNDTIERQAEGNNAVVKAVDQKHKVDITIENRTDQLKKDRKQRIQQIDTKYKNLSNSSSTDKVKDTEIATVQITSLWNTYCSFNENDQCSAVNNT